MGRNLARIMRALIVMPAVAAVSCDMGATGAGTFERAGSMALARTEFTAVLLSDGNVLVAGGHGADTGASSSTTYPAAELYDPSLRTFAPTGSMTTPRWQHTATVLPNGEVLIAGGADATSLDSAELYDPATGTFARTGSMKVARYRHTATLLARGSVLIAGPDATAELYDPADGTFTQTGSMTAARELPRATLLETGKVLLAGGSGTASADLYDPATGRFSATGAMSVARWGQTATLLRDGKVLVVGGYVQVDLGRILTTAEVYDPATWTFARAGRLTLPRVAHLATALSDGTVLVTGGVTNGPDLEPGFLDLSVTATAETFRAVGE